MGNSVTLWPPTPLGDVHVRRSMQVRPSGIPRGVESRVGGTHWCLPHATVTGGSPPVNMQCECPEGLLARTCMHALADGQNRCMFCLSSFCWNDLHAALGVVAVTKRYAYTHRTVFIHVVKSGKSTCLETEMLGVFYALPLTGRGSDKTVAATAPV